MPRLPTRPFIQIYVQHVGLTEFYCLHWNRSYQLPVQLWRYQRNINLLHFQDSRQFRYGDRVEDRGDEPSATPSINGPICWELPTDKNVFSTYLIYLFIFSLLYLSFIYFFSHSFFFHAVSLEKVSVPGANFTFPEVFGNLFFFKAVAL